MKVQLSFRASSKSFNRPLLSLFLIRSVRLMIFTSNKEILNAAGIQQLQKIAKVRG